MVQAAGKICYDTSNSYIKRGCMEWNKDLPENPDASKHQEFSPQM
jgi:hypothetical protein